MAPSPSGNHNRLSLFVRVFSTLGWIILCILVFAYTFLRPTRNSD